MKYPARLTLNGRKKILNPPITSNSRVELSAAAEELVDKSAKAITIAMIGGCSRNRQPIVTQVTFLNMLSLKSILDTSKGVGWYMLEVV
jgi:hypothetical protein